MKHPARPQASLLPRGGQISHLRSADPVTAFGTDLSNRTHIVNRQAKKSQYRRFKLPQANAFSVELTKF